MQRRRALSAVLLAVALAAGPVACGGSPQRSGDEGAAEGAGWRTWVLRTPSEVRVPPAEETAGQARDVAGARGADRRWSSEPSVAPWFETALDFVSQRTKDPPAGSRAYALVGVATYDAAVAAAHWRRAHGRDGYPSADAAIAGAASRVLAAAFPEHPRARLDELAEQAAAAAAADGETDGAGAQAGLALGREVARRVVGRVRADRVTGGPLLSPPERAGAWAPPPGSTARPVQPGAGRWTTWLLPRGDAVRPGPPPRYGSRAFLAEAREVMAVKERLTPEQVRIARFWEGGQGTELPPGIWVRAVLEYLRDRDVGGVRAARVMALLTVAMADAGVAAWDAKYAYWSPRPENAIRDLGLDPDWRPLLDTPFFPAYPSGHATYSGAAGEVLAHLFPEQRDTWRRRAQEASMSRLYGGIHYRSDNEEGMRMGRRIGRLAIGWAQRDGAEP